MIGSTPQRSFALIDWKVEQRIAYITHTALSLPVFLRALCTNFSLHAAVPTLMDTSMTGEGSRARFCMFPSYNSSQPLHTWRIGVLKTYIRYLSMATELSHTGDELERNQAGH